MDLVAEPTLFMTYQGEELNQIYYNAIKTYQINFKKLMSYAKRRGQEKNIKQRLYYQTDIDIKKIIYDY